MMVGILENVGLSTRYTFENLITHPLRWLGMIGLSFIPIARWVVYGTWIKPFRNEDPSFTGELFGPGFEALVISIIYSLPLIIINCLSIFVGIGAVVTVNILYGIFLLLFFPPAIANFGSTLKFTRAFNFKKMNWSITNCAGGWGHYIGSLFIYACIMGIVFLVSLIFAGVPVILAILYWIITPIIAIFSSKYWANMLVPDAALNGYHVMSEEEAHDAMRETIKYLPTFREEALIHKEQNHTLWIDAFLSYPQNIATFKAKIREYTNAEYTDEEVIRYLRWWFFEDTER